ncbi:hypothetical protein J3F84DRAFT_113551 [Trichoderma pleuroticola]
MAKSAPYISIPGVANFRDIGGTPIASHPGKEVRRNIVFRSARPDISTSRGKAKLQMLAITHTYDLRSTQEHSSSKSYDKGKLIWAGTTTRVSVPVFRPEEYAPDAVVARFAKHGASCEPRQRQNRRHQRLDSISLRRERRGRGQGLFPLGSRVGSASSITC